MGYPAPWRGDQEDFGDWVVMIAKRAVSIHLLMEKNLEKTRE